MSREIKFRAINKNGDMVYGLPRHDLPNSTAYYNEFSHRMCWHTESGGGANQPYKNGTLMQYTGLKDKNGVDIYEGDVIRISRTALDEKAMITDIYFFKGAFRYRHKDGSGSVCDWNSTSVVSGYERVTQDVEVIGNIYENPELLEASND